MRKFLLTSIIVALVVSVCLNIGMYRHLQTEVVKSDTVYKERIVEVRDSNPVVQEDKTIGQISVPVYSNSLKIGKNKHDSSSLKADSNKYLSHTDDSLLLDVVQRKYTDDSTYTAYVSGLKYGTYPRLDSIITKRRIIERTVTNTIYRDNRKMRVKLRPSVSAGYDPINGHWGVMIGGSLVFDW